MAEAAQMVELLEEAYRDVLKGQSVRYGDRQLTRADAAWIGNELQRWRRIAASESATAAGRMSGVSIADFSGVQ